MLGELTAPEIEELLGTEVIARIGPRPTLVEWDNDLPEWPVLAAEAARAARLLAGIGVPAHAC